MIREQGYSATTRVQETYDWNPDIRDACTRSIINHAAVVERDIELSRLQYGIEANWTAASLVLYSQAVLQGAFILANPTEGPEIEAESIDHLIRYSRLLFELSDNTASTINKQRK